jgi:hypothetical protein
VATKTVTIDTGEWKYIDSVGIPHIVNNAQTFTFTLTDGGIAAVTYEQDIATQVTTTDGYTLVFRRQADRGGQGMTIGNLTDAEQGTTVHNKRGELVVRCPVTGKNQYWRIAQIKVNDSDTPTAIQVLVLEDQFGHRMKLPSTGSGWTVS